MIRATRRALRVEPTIARRMISGERAQCAEEGMRFAEASSPCPCSLQHDVTNPISILNDGPEWSRQLDLLLGLYMWRSVSAIPRCSA